MAVKSLAQSSLRQNPQLNSMLAGYQPNAFHHLETVRLGGNAASVEFTNLARYSDYQHLQIRVVARSSVASSRTELAIRVNGDAGNNYAGHSLYGFNNVVYPGTEANVSRLVPGWIAGANLSSTIYSPLVIDLLDPFELKNKVFKSLSGVTNDGLIGLLSGVWFNTAPTTSLTVYPLAGSLVSGSRFSLYGIKAKA